MLNKKKFVKLMLGMVLGITCLLLTNFNEVKAEELPALFGVETPMNAARSSYAQAIGETPKAASAAAVAADVKDVEVAIKSGGLRSAASVNTFEFKGGNDSPYYYGTTRPEDFYLRYAFDGNSGTEIAVTIRLYYPIDFAFPSSTTVANFYEMENLKAQFSGQSIGTKNGSEVVIDGRRYIAIDHTITNGQNLEIVEQPMSHMLNTVAAFGEDYFTLGFPDNYQFKIMADVLDSQTGLPLRDRIEQNFTWKYSSRPAAKAVSYAQTVNKDVVKDYNEDSQYATLVTVGQEKSEGAGQTSLEKATYVEYRFKIGTIKPMSDIVIEDTLPAGAEFDQAKNPNWTKVGNVVTRVVPLKEWQAAMNETYSFSLLLRYPNAKQGDEYVNNAAIKATVAKNQTVIPGVTYTPYMTPTSNPIAYEQNWSVKKPITADIKKIDIGGSLFTKAGDPSHTYYDTESVRKTGYLYYKLTLQHPKLSFVYKAGELVLTDEPKDARFEVADVSYVTLKNPMKATDGSSLDKTSFDCEALLDDGTIISIPNLSFSSNPLDAYRGHVKKITIKNNKEIIGLAGEGVQFQIRLRAKDYTKPLLTSSNVVKNILNEGGFKTSTGSIDTYNAYAPIQSFSQAQSLSKPEKAVQLEYNASEYVDPAKEVPLPAPTLQVAKGDILKDVTVTYLLPSRRYYEIGTGTTGYRYDVYEKAKNDIQEMLNNGTLVLPSVATVSGGKVELIESKLDENENVINKDGYKGTGKVGLVISFSRVEMEMDLTGTNATDLSSFFYEKISIMMRAKEFSPASDVIPVYFKGTPVNFDSSKYTVYKQRADALDINNNGNTTELVSYEEQPVFYKRPFVLKGIKEAKGALDTYYKDSSEISKTTLDGKIDYQLTVYNELETTTVTNVTLIDVLPRKGDTLYTQTEADGTLIARKSEYDVYLASPEAPAKVVECRKNDEETLTTDAKYAYCTKAIPKDKTTFDSFVSNESNWTDKAPTDLKTVTAIRVSGVTLLQGESMRVNFDASVDPTVLGRKLAMNSFAVRTAEGDNIESNIVKTEVQGAKNRDITIKKKWDDKNNATGTRPKSIEVKLLQDDEVYKTATITDAGDQPWSYTFKDLPVDHETDKGIKEWKYTIQEVNTKDYISSTSKPVETIVKGADGKYTHDTEYTLTNKLKKELLKDIPVTKKWLDINNQAGKRPASVKIQLKQNGVAYKAPVVLTGGSTTETWTYTFTNLPSYDDDGKAYVYTVVEVDAAGEEVSKIIIDEDAEYIVSNGNASNNYTITNELLEKITVTKNWEDENNDTGMRPASITIKLSRSWKVDNDDDIQASEIYKTVTLTGGATLDTWTYTFEKLPMYSPKGTLYTYSVDENTVDYYDKTISSDGLTITNTLNVERDITVKKVWKLLGGAVSPTSVKVQLKQDGINIGGVVTLSAKGSTVTKAFVTPWAHTYKDLPVYSNQRDENGNLVMYKYTVEEVDTGGDYHSVIVPTYQGDDKNKPVIGFTINNYSPIKLYVLQKVLDPVDSIPLPNKGFQKLREIDIFNEGAGTSAGLTSKSVTADTATETGSPLSDYTEYTIYPERDRVFTIEDFVPEYYSFVGVTATTDYVQSSHVSTSLSTSNKQPGTLKYYENNRVSYDTYYVTFYITPKFGIDEDNPRPYSWSYKTNTFGK